MTWLLHNPLVDLPGPQFLGAFWAAAAVVFATVRAQVRRLDPSLGAEPPPAKFKLDAREIACLRGGSRAVLHTMTFDLWRRGFLRLDATAIRGGPRISVAEDGADFSELPEEEGEVIAALGTPRELSSLNRVATLMGLAERRTAELEDTLRDEGLLMPEGTRAQARSIACLGAAVLSLLGVWKFWVAMTTGHFNVGFLILSTVVAIPATFLAARTPRRTRRGTEYLSRMETALGKWSAQPRDEHEEVASPTAVLAVAVLGYAALAGTSHGAAWLSKGTAAGKAVNGGGCGGGCGIAGGCGAAAAGCGGGGGGCGGGGCGGCGGCGG